MVEARRSRSETSQRGFDQTGKFPDFLEASAFTTEVKDMLVKLKAALEAKMGAGEEEFEL